MGRCHQGECCLDKCHYESWHLSKMVPGWSKSSQWQLIYSWYGQMSPGRRIVSGVQFRRVVCGSSIPKHVMMWKWNSDAVTWEFRSHALGWELQWMRIEKVFHDRLWRYNFRRPLWILNVQQLLSLKCDRNNFLFTTIHSCLESKIYFTPTMLIYLILTELIEIPWRVKHPG